MGYVSLPKGHVHSTYMGVSLNGGYPPKHPKMIIFVGKPMVVGVAPF